VKLLDSLLDAIVRLEGDALVMHVGEKPYVVTTSAAMSAYRGPLAWGQVELSSRVLTPDAVLSMLAQILPPEQRHALDEIGAIEQEIASPAGIADRFTVVAARGGDDIWLELRRQPAPVVVPEPIAEEHPAMVAEPEAADAAGMGVGGYQPAPAAARDTSAEIPEAPQAHGPEPPSHEPAAAPDPEEIQERVPVLDEVGQHQPEHVEHMVISVGGRDGHEEVPLDSVPNDAFEVVDEVTQEAPSDSEVDDMLAATAAALLTSGLGADVETVEDHTLDAGDFIASGDATDDEHPDSAWTEVGVDAETARPPAIAPGPDPAVVAVDDRPVDVAPLAEGDAGAEPDAAAIAAPPEPELELTPAAVDAEPGEAGRVIVHEAVTMPAAAADPEPSAAVPESPVAASAPVEEGPDAPVVEARRDDEPSFGIAPDEVEIAPDDDHEEEEAAEIEAPPVAAARVADAPVEEPIVDEPVAAGPPAPWPEPLIPETAAAALAPAASTDELRTHVSEPISELHGHGAHAPASYSDSHADARPGVVPARGAARSDGGSRATATLQSALRTAGARGASTVYLVAQSKPVIRVNGEIIVLENEPALSAADVQGVVAELAPPQQRGSQADELEWMSDVPDVGRVRCLTFRDHRGPGVIFRMDHAGLSAEVRALCAQPDGLVLIAGPHASGKSTLLNAFVDQINVTRGDHVITLESRIGFVHESRKSFISQRELGEEASRAAASARAALREDPDVLVIEDLRSADLAAVALEAAESGRLLFATVSAPSAVSALEQVLESFPADRRGRAARSLASALRGVISQVLVRRTRGGRAPAREVLPNTPTVASMIRDGRTGDLPAAFESGRAQGAVSMTDALVGLVREGAVPAAEAYRKASDRATLVGRLKQEGVDTAFADRLV
jgi:twitching motility protein PilT